MSQCRRCSHALIRLCTWVRHSLSAAIDKTVPNKATSAFAPTTASPSTEHKNRFDTHDHRHSGRRPSKHGKQGYSSKYVWRSNSRPTISSDDDFDFEPSSGQDDSQPTLNQSKKLSQQGTAKADLLSKACDDFDFAPDGSHHTYSAPKRKPQQPKAKPAADVHLPSKADDDFDFGLMSADRYHFLDEPKQKPQQQPKAKSAAKAESKAKSVAKADSQIKTHSTQTTVAKQSFRSSHVPQVGSACLYTCSHFGDYSGTQALIFLWSTSLLLLPCQDCIKP